MPTSMEIVRAFLSFLGASDLGTIYPTANPIECNSRTDERTNGKLTAEVVDSSAPPPPALDIKRPPRMTGAMAGCMDVQ